MQLLYWGWLQSPFNLAFRLLLLFSIALPSLYAQAQVSDPEPTNFPSQLALSPAQQLLEKMVSANQRLTYKGRFTYEHGGALSTMEIVHAHRDGVIHERLAHLNGPRRELMRKGASGDCRKPSESLLLDLSPVSSTVLSDHYGLLIKGDGRVAGRDVDVLHLIPKDKYRFGYSLALDKQTGLLLQTMLIGSKRKVLERFQFVYVDIGPLMGDEELMPGQQDYYVVSSTVESCEQRGEEGNPWVVGWLPPGFVLSGYQEAMDDEPETLVYTDGLAVFSVFVEREPQGVLPEVQGQRGATVAFLTNKLQDGSHYRVCVVGEIPSATARQVAQSLTLLLEP